MTTNTAPMRAFLGFVAGTISVLVVHQGLWALLHAAGQIAQAPYPTHPVPPFGIPLIASLCFWGGVYGAIYGVLRPRLKAPRWLCGLGLGLIATLIGWFVVAPLHGMPAAHGWHGGPMSRSALLDIAWGLGVSVILPLLAPRVVAHA